MSLSNLKAPKGAHRERKRVGRGQGSGLGKTAGRGAKGQKARTGNMHFEGFEGGQSPLQRRLPKFGFTNVFRRDFDEVQVVKLDRLPAGVVDQAALAQAGLARKNADGVVVLGGGELKGAYTVKVERVTAGARAAIEKAGGTVELLPKLQTMGEKARAVARAERAAKVAAKPKPPPAAEKPEKAEKKAKKKKDEPQA
jgi:large subunit ribosomal protein L15